MMEEFNIDNITIGEWLAILIGGASLVVSIVVLIITYKSWLLKNGQSIRASYDITSSCVAGGPYVSRVIIENLKDKDLVIFNVYLKLGANVYIDLLNIESGYDKYHHIIPALSTRIFELGPPYINIEHSNEVDLKKFRVALHYGRIVLATNHGKIKAKRFKRGWSPISQYFRNYATVHIRTHRLYLQTSVPASHIQSEQYIDYSSVGKHVRYFVNLMLDSNKPFEFQISEHEKYVLFENLDFSESVLESKETLKEYLLDCKAKNLVSFKEILSIFDVQGFISENRKRLDLDPDGVNGFEILNPFQYYVIYQIKTWLYKLQNPCFPSKLFSFYCFLGIKKHPNKRKSKDKS